MKKILLIYILFITNLIALEFGYMGNKAFGMGGSGVALNSNPFNLYYNPSLFNDGEFQIGYSFGVRYKEYNVSKLADLNINNFKNFLQDNSLNLTSENGLALQIPIRLGGKFSSALSIGAFYTKIGTINFLANGLNNATISNGTLSNAKIIVNGFDLLEIPIAYALNIYDGFGNFKIGVSAKYINAKHSLDNQQFSGSDIFKDAFNKVLKPKNGISTNTMGVDVGLSYALPFDTLVVGIVGKNLNSPKINTIGNERFRLEPQYRFGLASAIIPLTTIAFDIDLKQNTEFRGLDNGLNKKKTQYISLGGIFDIKFFDVRLGIAKNIANTSEGLLVYAGLGFKIIDISLFSNTNMARFNNIKIPSEFGIKIGGGFGF